LIKYRLLISISNVDERNMTANEGQKITYSANICSCFFSHQC
jgi:hypothetical protein